MDTLGLRAALNELSLIKQSNSDSIPVDDIENTGSDQEQQRLQRLKTVRDLARVRCNFRVNYNLRLILTSIYVLIHNRNFGVPCVEFV